MSWRAAAPRAGACVLNCTTLGGGDTYVEVYIASLCSPIPARRGSASQPSPACRLARSASRGMVFSAAKGRRALRGLQRIVTVYVALGFNTVRVWQPRNASASHARTHTRSGPQRRRGRRWPSRCPRPAAVDPADGCLARHRPAAVLSTSGTYRPIRGRRCLAFGAPRRDRTRHRLGGAAGVLSAEGWRRRCIAGRVRRSGDAVPHLTHIALALRGNRLPLTTGAEAADTAT